MCGKTVETNELMQENLQNQYPEGELPVLRACSTLDDYKKGEVNRHWHSEFQFGLILKGEIDYGLFRDPVTKTNRILRPGDGFFINSKALHEYRQRVPATEVFTFGMSPSFFATPVFGNLYQNIILPVIHSRVPGLFFSAESPADRQILDLFQKFRDLRPDDRDYELQCIELVCRIWRKLYHCFENQNRLSDSSGINGTQAIRIRKMLDFIHQHYHEPLTVEQIASAGEVSKRECFRCFRSIIDQSPVEYLTQYRLSVAARLLTSTNNTLSAICEACGFENLSYFTKRFKQRYGTLPRQFRG